MTRLEMFPPHVLLVFIVAFVNNMALTSPHRNEAGPLPNLRSVPSTSFTCEGRPAGYYADTEAQCQAYHMCDTLELQYSYLCPGYTLFNQKFMVCDHWHAVNCSIADQYYDLNEMIGQVPEKDSLAEENNMIQRETKNTNLNRLSTIFVINKPQRTTTVKPTSNRFQITRRTTPRSFTSKFRTTQRTTPRTFTNKFQTTRRTTPRTFTNKFKTTQRTTPRSSTNRFQTTRRTTPRSFTNKFKTTQRTTPRTFANKFKTTQRTTPRTFTNKFPPTQRTTTRIPAFKNKFQTTTRRTTLIPTTQKIKRTSTTRRTTPFFTTRTTTARTTTVTKPSIITPPTTPNPFSTNAGFTTNPFQTKIKSLSARGSGLRIKFGRGDSEEEEQGEKTIDGIKLRPLFKKPKKTFFDKVNFTISPEILASTPATFVAQNTNEVIPQERLLDIDEIIPFLIPPLIESPSRPPNISSFNFLSPFLVPPPKAPVILHGENQEFLTPLVVSRIEPPRRSISFPPLHSQITPPRFPFSGSNPDFFIPAPGLIPPLPDNSISLEDLEGNNENDKLDSHKMTMTFPTKSTFSRRRPLRINPKCPRCHPAFLRPNECQPCVIIK